MEAVLPVGRSIAGNAIEVAPGIRTALAVWPSLPSTLADILSLSAADSLLPLAW